jgi:FtsP/CotA-like multicopper oxidase with cupredoxin domain
MPNQGAIYTMSFFSCWQILWVLSLAAASFAKVVRDELTLTWEVDAPNGQAREMVKMNGQFPGPAMIWDEGDDVEVGTPPRSRMAAPAD